jgi:hypothetical protein
MPSLSPYPPGSSAHALAQEVQQQFQSWRKQTPKHCRRLSGELWAAAVRLAHASTVYQTVRLLGLDYSQLKQRVLEAYGPECAALNGRRKRERGSDSEPTSSKPGGQISPGKSLDFRASASGQSAGRFPVLSPSAGPQKRPHGLQSPPEIIASLRPVTGPGGGFLEVPFPRGPEGLGPPLLADVRSPSGWILRLYSPETGGIIQAFLAA